MMITVAPIFMESNSKGGHHWLVEFAEEPQDIAIFTEQLDKKLRSINSDYDAKRHKDIALQNLVIEQAPKGTFSRLAQIKRKAWWTILRYTRLSNERKYIEDLQHFIKTK